MQQPEINSCEFRKSKISDQRIAYAEITLIGAKRVTAVKLRLGDNIEVTMARDDVHELVRLLNMNVPIY